MTNGWKRLVVDLLEKEVHAALMRTSRKKSDAVKLKTGNKVLYTAIKSTNLILVDRVVLFLICMSKFFDEFRTTCSTSSNKSKTLASTSKAIKRSGPGFVELPKKSDYQSNPEKYVKLL